MTDNNSDSPSMAQKLAERRREHDRGVQDRLGEKVPPKHGMPPIGGHDPNADEESGGANDKLRPGR